MSHPTREVIIANQFDLEDYRIRHRALGALAAEMTLQQRTAVDPDRALALEEAVRLIEEHRAKLKSSQDLCEEFDTHFGGNL